MDWRQDYDYDELGPGFLYAVPLGPDRVLLEETCLAGLPAPTPGDLSARLRSRLRRRGVPGSAIDQPLAVEQVRIPLLPPLRGPVEPRVEAFGTAGGHGHAATGYSVSGTLGAVPAAVVALGSGRPIPPPRSPLATSRGLPPIRVGPRTPNDVLEAMVALHREVLRLSEQHIATPEEARRANTVLRGQMRDRGNHYGELEAKASELLRAVRHDGGPFTTKDVNALARHLGFEVRHVDDLPHSTRSVIDLRNHRIYLARQASTVGHDQRSVLLQALGHHVLGHTPPADYAEFLAQRVQTNYLAGAITLPEAGVVAMLRAGADARDLDVGDIADAFKVSWETAAHRVTNLATRHLGFPLHFAKVHETGTVYKAYENDGIVFPMDPTGAIEGQPVCRQWASRQVFERGVAEGEAFHQFTDTPAGTYWDSVRVERTAGGADLGGGDDQGRGLADGDLRLPVVVPDRRARLQQLPAPGPRAGLAEAGAPGLVQHDLLRVGLPQLARARRHARDRRQRAPVDLHRQQRPMLRAQVPGLEHHPALALRRGAHQVHRGLGHVPVRRVAEVVVGQPPPHGRQQREVGDEHEQGAQYPGRGHRPRLPRRVAGTMTLHEDRMSPPARRPRRRRGTGLGALGRLGGTAGSGSATGREADTSKRMSDTPELLDSLIRTPAPSGYETPAAEVWRAAARAIDGAELRTDTLGSSVAEVSGGEDAAPRLAIEVPSAGMRAAMREYREMTGAPEIREIPSRWEDADPAEVGKHDVVVASFSLALDDIGPSLLKMDSAAKRSVHLFWFLTPPTWTAANFKLWPKLHGNEYTAEPTADLLWNCLCQLGIYPHVLVEHVEKGQCYPAEEEAVADYCRRLYVRDDRQREIVASFVHERVVQTQAGFWIPGVSKTAHIRWEKEE